MEYLLCVLAGFLIGVINRGIQIHIFHNNKEVTLDKKPTKYNESTITELPDEIRTYFDKNQGYIK